MSTEGFEAKKADMTRLWGTCALCKETKFFIKRILIKLPTGVEVISPNHLCKPCRKVVESKLQ